MREQELGNGVARRSLACGGDTRKTASISKSQDQQTPVPNGNRRVFGGSPEPTPPLEGNASGVFGGTGNRVAEGL